MCDKSLSFYRSLRMSFQNLRVLSQYISKDFLSFGSPKKFRELNANYKSIKK